MTLIDWECPLGCFAKLLKVLRRIMEFTNRYEQTEMSLLVILPQTYSFLLCTHCTCHVAKRLIGKAKCRVTDNKIRIELDSAFRVAKGGFKVAATK